MLSSFSPTFPGFYLYYPSRHDQASKLKALIEYTQSSHALTETPLRESAAVLPGRVLLGESLAVVDALQQAANAHLRHQQGSTCRPSSGLSFLPEAGLLQPAAGGPIAGAIASLPLAQMSPGGFFARRQPLALRVCGPAGKLALNGKADSWRRLIRAEVNNFRASRTR